MKAYSIFKMILGFIALALGSIGVFLPVLPTTPFILLALWCFSSVPALKNRILEIGFFREYYENYIHGYGIRKSTVITTLIFLWAMLIGSAFMAKKLYVIFILLAVGVLVSIHILRRSSGRRKKSADDKDYPEIKNKDE